MDERGGPPDTGSGFRDELTPAELQQEGLSQVPQFESTTFVASLKGARVTVGGDLELTVTVPITEKYRALLLTDAPGVMLVFNVRRKPRGV